MQRSALKDLKEISEGRCVLEAKHGVGAILMECHRVVCG